MNIGQFLESYNRLMESSYIILWIFLKKFRETDLAMLFCRKLILGGPGEHIVLKHLKVVRRSANACSSCSTPAADLHIDTSMPVLTAYFPVLVL